MTTEEQVRHRLAFDTPYYAERFVTIVDKQTQDRTLLKGKPAQLRFDQALEAQREAGLPMRAIVLKSRQMGFSTWTMAKIMQRVTQQPNHVGLIIAQDSETAKALMRKAEMIYSYLPDDQELGIKPAIVNRKAAKEMRFGEPSRQLREAGAMGLDSSLTIDTAREFEAKRGFTCHELHATEVGFWPDLKRKLTGLLQTVPQSPSTMVVLESTANGYNWFRDLWRQAEDGKSDFIAVFFPWFEEPGYTRPFLAEEDRADFEDTLGQGEYGEAEPLLLELGVNWEQLNWRRWAINNLCQGDLRLFQQEYPSTPDEAFLSTGQQVFSPQLVQKVIQRTRKTDPAANVGLLQAGKTIQRKGRHGLVEVPAEPMWVPKEATGFGSRHPFWKLWLPRNDDGQLAPDPKGQYIVAVDPAGGATNDDGEGAYSAIQVMDHTTRTQVAEYRARTDPDLIARDAYLAAVWFNNAWLITETTGGYGLSIARRHWQDWKYPFTYRRQNLGTVRERQEERLGWDTNRATKGLLEDGLREVLREETDGIKSAALADEFTTYVKDKKGKTGPEANSHSDLLMAWAICHQVAQEKVPRPDRAKGAVSTTGRAVFNPITGY